MIALFKSVDVRFPRGLARYIIVVFVQFQYEENEAADFRGFSRYEGNKVADFRNTSRATCIHSSDCSFNTKEIRGLISEGPCMLHHSSV